MSISRRKFLQTGTLAALTAGLPLKVLANETVKTATESSPLLTAARAEASRLNSAAFRKCLNTNFRVRQGSGDSRLLKLVEVKHWHSQPSKATDRECFSNLFVAADSRQLRQGTYTVAHESLGTFQMFLVPIGKKNSEFRYEALFNRLH
jgi:hypothetical protein